MFFQKRSNSYLSSSFLPSFLPSSLPSSLASSLPSSLPPSLASSLPSAFLSYPILRFICAIASYSLLNSPSSLAIDQIIRPYQSVRSAGMGGVRITTGLYDENFFNNPARVTANPESKLTVLQLTPVETSVATAQQVQNLIGSSNTLKTVVDSAGTDLHNRVQMVLPAYYLASTEDRKFAVAIGMIASVQADAALRRSFQANFDGVLDIGPAVTVGRKFLSDDSLSIGVTGHLTYRLATAPNYSILNYIQGSSLGLNAIGGGGSMINFDLGSTYKITQIGEFQLNTGGAIQNILGSNYNLGIDPLKMANLPLGQPRSYGLGFSLTRADWWRLTRTTFAFEVTDVLNNMNGSIYRLLHLGGETHWKSLAFRLGLNQGYISGGIGLDVHYFTLDLASYGEELGLNVGTFEDRRYTLNFGFHI